MGDNMFVLLLAITCTIIVSYWVMKALNKVWWKPRKIEKCLRQQGMTGTKYKFLIGDLKEAMSMNKEAISKPIKLSHNIAPRIMPLVHQTVQKYGTNSFIWLGATPMMNIMDPELIKEILANKSGNISKINPNPLVKLLADGLVNHEGEKWARHRKIINPAFHLEKLKLMVPAFYASCDELVVRWEKLVSNGSFELDVWPEFQMLTGDSISRTAFGSSYEEGRRIFQLQTELAKLIIEFFDSQLFSIFRFLPTKRNRRMTKINREISTILTDMINKREKAIEAGAALKGDLLGLLLDSNKKHIEEHDNSKKVGLTTNEIIEECKLFYIAGQETTSSLLVWTMILLSMHPEWQDKARKEVLEVFGTDKPSFDGLNNLKIVTMILFEVLRLYPPVVLLARENDKEVKIGNLTIPPGVQLAMPTLLVHHDRELWGEDAEEFKPERFSGGISEATKNQVLFFPFGWGARICIGQKFAIVEAKMALAMILQRFSFELSPMYAHAPYDVVTLQPQYGAQIILHKLILPIVLNDHLDYQFSSIS
ncbi:hypothetical protein Syun_027439 [Stephania yunnanensis]|uniref:Cytochrome P450 n=1 Tax=Stephania yunnanensis TaxID=152371 RepID=A0AAP0EMW8_9MAGN